MLRSLLALAVTFSVSNSAFAQQPDHNKVTEAVIKLKDWTTQYDVTGRGQYLAKIGGNTLLYSLAAYGATTAMLLPTSPAAQVDAAVVADQAAATVKKVGVKAGVTSRFNNLRKTSTHWFRVKPESRRAKVAKRVQTGAAAIAVTAGVAITGASALTFIYQHIKYGALGQPVPQTAALNQEQKDVVAFFSQPTEAILAQVEQNPALGEDMIELAKSIHVTAR